MTHPGMRRGAALRNGVLVAVLAAFTSGCMTQNAYTGEKQVSKTTKGAFLVNLVIAGHAAYRTQLFCYLKSCGRDELNTMNLWAGMDAPATV